MSDNPVLDAVETLKKEMQSDEHYAWSWHCNLAMMAYDAGAFHKEANIQAAIFMDTCFGVDTSEIEAYKNIMKQYELIGS